MVLQNFNLAGKTAIVTGCNTGLGQGMALALAQAGADIVGVNVTEPDQTQAGVEALGRRFLDLRANLGDISCIPDLVNQAKALNGAVHILVNNAGIIRREDAIKFSEADWDDVMDLNLKSVFFLSQAVAKAFMAQGSGGKIINIASMLSFQGGIRVPSYTASKSGVMGITRLMANEWAAHGINVNAIAPGYIDTEMVQAVPQNVLEGIISSIPVGRLGSASEIARCVAFLAADDAGFITGATLTVNGGQYIAT